MSSTWTEQDYAALATLVFRDDYPGNAPARGVVEAPDGNPGARDAGKRYAHVACKYLDGGQCTNPRLYWYLEDAFEESRRVAHELGVPVRFHPCYGAGCLRILEYPAGVGASHVHTDISLFTVNLWRSHPNPGLGGRPWHMGRLGAAIGLGEAEPHFVAPLAERQCALVYFAIPDHGARLPGGMLVGEWLERELRTMRYTADEAEEK